MSEKIVNEELTTNLKIDTTATFTTTTKTLATGGKMFYFYFITFLNRVSKTQKGNKTPLLENNLFIELAFYSPKVHS